MLRDSYHRGIGEWVIPTLLDEIVEFTHYNVSNKGQDTYSIFCALCTVCIKEWVLIWGGIFIIASTLKVIHKYETQSFRYVLLITSTFYQAKHNETTSKVSSITYIYILFILLPRICINVPIRAHFRGLKDGRLFEGLGADARGAHLIFIYA